MDTQERRPLLNSGAVAQSYNHSPPPISFPSETTKPSTARPQRPKIERPPTQQRWSSLPFPVPPTPIEERQANAQSYLGSLLWPAKHEELPYPAVTYDEETGLPRITRSCIVSEAKCYGKWVIPTLLVFGVLAISLAFFLSQHW